jgi:hypothetical protein
MLGSSMRRVGLIDITVGNATRLGASQRSATRRSASHHIATQRLSRRGSPAARARLVRTAPLKRLWLRDGHVKRNTCERMNSPLRDNKAPRREGKLSVNLGRGPDVQPTTSAVRIAARRRVVFIPAIPPSAAPREVSYSIRETVSGRTRTLMEGSATQAKAEEGPLWPFERPPAFQPLRNTQSLL